MPAIRYNIGTVVTNPRYGTCVVIGNYDDKYGYPNNDTRMLHMYSFKEDTFICLRTACVTKISDNEPELLQKAQTALLTLIDDSNHSDIGKHITYKTQHNVFEYLQLTKTYEINNRQYALFAYRDYPLNIHSHDQEWSLDYTPLDHTLIGQMTTTRPTAASINEAKQILLEKVILPAFTTL